MSAGRPVSFHVWNNAGVLRHLSGKHEMALEALQYALSMTGSSTPSVQVRGTRGVLRGVVAL